MKLFLVPEGSTLAVEGLDTNLACLSGGLCFFWEITAMHDSLVVFFLLSRSNGCPPPPLSLSSACLSLSTFSPAAPRTVLRSKPGRLSACRPPV